MPIVSFNYKPMASSIFPEEKKNMSFSCSVFENMRDYVFFLNYFFFFFKPNNFLALYGLIIYVKTMSFELYYNILKENTFLDTCQSVSHGLKTRKIFQR